MFDFLISEEEKTLEEQINLWEKNNLDIKKINKIIFQKPIKQETALIPDHVYDDLEFFNVKDKKGKCILSSLKKTKTPYGESVLRHLLKSSLINENKIKERQLIIRKLTDTKGLLTKFDNIWNNLNNSQDIFWFWKNNDETSQTLHDLIYYQTPIIANLLNTSESFLLATTIYKMFLSPLSFIAMPILYIMLPYLYIRYYGINISFCQVFTFIKNSLFTIWLIPGRTKFLTILSTLGWFIMYLYNSYSLCKYAMLTNKISNIIHSKLKVAHDTVKVSREIINLTSYYPKNIKNIICLSECNIETELLLLNDTINSEPSMFSNKGKILSTFWKIKNRRDDLGKRIKFIGFIDAYYTISKYLKSSERAGLYWCYSFFDKNVKKKEFRDIWHPVLWDKKKKPITNTLNIKKNTRTILLTGANAAGKSTFVRTFLVNSLLSQSLGIALAKKWVMKEPYLLLDTYLNVPDVEGYSSLFQAEMYRCEEFLKLLNGIKNNNKCRAIVALDEVFSSTNFKEGYSAAYSIVNYLSKNYPELICFVTTHFHELTELEKKTKSKVKNYCLKVNRDEKGKITGYPFKIYKGVSKEHIALELLEENLKENGLSGKIIEKAKQIYSTLK
jgi:DNA mismatch repair ATPase MutS